MESILRKLRDTSCNLDLDYVQSIYDDLSSNIMFVDSESQIYECHDLFFPLRSKEMISSMGLDSIESKILAEIVTRFGKEINIKSNIDDVIRASINSKPADIVRVIQDIMPDYSFANIVIKTLKIPYLWNRNLAIIGAIKSNSTMNKILFHAISNVLDMNNMTMKYPGFPIQQSLQEHIVILSNVLYCTKSVSINNLCLLTLLKPKIMYNVIDPYDLIVLLKNIRNNEKYEQIISNLDRSYSNNELVINALGFD